MTIAVSASVYREKMVHIIFGDNVKPQIDSHGVENNFVLANFSLNKQSFIADFEEEFNVDLTPVWHKFKTVGDIVVYVESLGNGNGET